MFSMDMDPIVMPVVLIVLYFFWLFSLSGIKEIN
jgi:uncharacterized membrane protein (DUF106 family)